MLLILHRVTDDIEQVNDTLFITSTAFELIGSNSYFGELVINTTGNIYNIGIRPNTEGISTLIKTFDDKYVIGCNYEHPNNNRDIYLYKINDSLEMDTVYPGSYTYDSLFSYQIESGIIDITDCLLITDVGETPSPKEYFASLNTIPIKPYPNPATKGEITFELQHIEHYKNMELRCFNVYGKQVHSETVYRFQGLSKVNLSNWKAGIYIAIIYSENMVVGQTKFVVQ